LEKVAGGDQAAFEQLFLLYQAQVYGVVLAVLRDQTQAQEVTQEVFLQLWQQASRFDATLSSTATWIKRLARTRAVDRVRLCESAGARDTRYTAASKAVDYDSVIERCCAVMNRHRCGNPCSGCRLCSGNRSCWPTTRD